MLVGLGCVNRHRLLPARQETLGKAGSTFLRDERALHIAETPHRTQRAGGVLTRVDALRSPALRSPALRVVISVKPCCMLCLRSGISHFIHKHFGALGVRSVTVLPRPASPKEVGGARSGA
jgi:hypothetical protein